MIKHANILIKPVSGDCNMACGYCFYQDVSSRRSEGNLGKMNMATLETTIRRALEESEIGCSFAFQGGEPTLAGLDFFRHLLEFEKKYNSRNIIITNVIQTNGYLLNHEWAEFFSKNNFLVGVSLDGDEELHNATRFDRNGGKTFGKVMETVACFDRYRVKYNVLCVINSCNACQPERLYNFFREHGMKFLQFVPCLDPLEEKRGVCINSLKPQEYESFLKRMFDLWYLDCKKHDGISIRQFDNWLGIFLGREPENCAMNGQCAAYFVVEADGGVYPCDFYVTDGWKMGNILDSKLSELTDCGTAKRFAADSGRLINECRACKYFFLCRGGCRRDRDNGKSLIQNYYCDTFNKFFTYTIDRFRELSLMFENPYNVG